MNLNIIEYTNSVGYVYVFKKEYVKCTMIAEA